MDFEHLRADEEPSKANEIKVKIAHIERQIAKLKGALEAMEDPTKAVSLATMLTDYDTQRAQLLKDLEAETIAEKGSTKLTKSHYEYLKSLFGSEKKLQDPQTRLEIQEALRASIDRITIDTKTQSYTVSWKNHPDVYKVELLKTGYRVSGKGCVNLKFTYGDMLDLPRQDTADLKEAA